MTELKKLHCSIEDGDCTKCTVNPFCAYYKFIFPLEQQQTPKKPVSNGTLKIQCPNCEFELYNEWVDYTFNYCPRCGQRIDWSDEKW